MVWKHEGPSTSTKIDQWNMLGCEDIKEEKDKQGHWKGEDEGKLSPQRMVFQGQRPQWVS